MPAPVPDRVEPVIVSLTHGPSAGRSGRWSKGRADEIEPVVSAADLVTAETARPSPDFHGLLSGGLTPALKTVQFCNCGMMHGGMNVICQVQPYL